MAQVLESAKIQIFIKSVSEGAIYLDTLYAFSDEEFEDLKKTIHEDYDYSAGTEQFLFTVTKTYCEEIVGIDSL